MGGGWKIQSIKRLSAKYQVVTWITFNLSTRAGFLQCSTGTFHADNLSVWLQPYLFPKHSFCMGNHMHPCLARLWEYGPFPMSALSLLCHHTAHLHPAEFLQAASRTCQVLRRALLPPTTQWILCVQQTSNQGLRRPCPLLADTLDLYK